MAQKQPAQMAIEILSAARRWAQARVKLRGILDSRSATDGQKKSARRVYSRTSDELEGYVLRLEKLLAATGQVVSMAKQRAQGNPWPWREILGLVSVGAKAVQDAIEPPAGTTSSPGAPYDNVVDTKGE